MSISLFNIESEIMTPMATSNGHANTAPPKITLRPCFSHYQWPRHHNQTTFTVSSPVGGGLWQSSSAPAEDATKAIEAAQASFPPWSMTNPVIRRDIFLKAAELFEQRKDELARYQMEETEAEASFIDWILPLAID
jgi:acyl-CoA reductase-like NAD-dependent aldehyde dehydrogenase